MKKIFLIITVLFSHFTVSVAKPIDDSCKVCERLDLIMAVKDAAARTYWKTWASAGKMPLLYTTDSFTYVAFSDQFPLKGNYSTIKCPGGLQVYKTQRIGSKKFYMENQMDFTNKTSAFYFRPMMACSDAEATVAMIPDFKTTEEWAQLLMHEYFHSFQFSHQKLLRTFSRHIPVGEDSLTAIYSSNKWFADSLGKENMLLLQAISTTYYDSTLLYLRQFKKIRSARRELFKARFGYDIAPYEDFWEKIEGTARYVEYYTALLYAKAQWKTNMTCDPLFGNFSAFKVPALEQTNNFVIRTKIMRAYYYVTGFNMCRLLDKLKVDYKRELFSKPRQSLWEYIAML